MLFLSNFTCRQALLISLLFLLYKQKYVLYFHFLNPPPLSHTFNISLSLIDILLPHAPVPPAPPLMKPMATSGGMASPFFPPNFILQMQQPLPHHQPQQDHHGHGHSHHHPLEHHLLPPPPPAQLNPFLQDFGGAGSMAPPPMLGGGKRSPPPMYPDGDDDASNHHELAGHAEPLQDGAAASDDEEGSVAGCGGAEKKRRLSVEQVRTLEKNFELGNKLEPERKLQLARALGLQPRQVAIWFQNRRARWKTKQLEKDYDALRRQLDAARAENDALLAHNNKLQAEIVALKGGGGGRQEAASELINLNVKETEGSCSNRSENSSEINLDVSRPAAPAAAAVESPMNRGGAIPFYASVGRPGASVDIDQLLHSHSSSPAVAPRPKMELGSGNGNADTAATATNFGSLLCGAVDEPPPFWPWADGHHHFH